MPNLFSRSTWTLYIWKQKNRQTMHYKLVTTEGGDFFQLREL